MGRKNRIATRASLTLKSFYEKPCEEIAPLVASIERTPIAAMTLAQVLRCTEGLAVEAAMTVESLAYATLQGGAEYQAWLKTREVAPETIVGGEGEPIITERSGSVVTAMLIRLQPIGFALFKTRAGYWPALRPG